MPKGNKIQDQYTDLPMSATLKYYYRHKNSEISKAWRKNDNTRKRFRYKTDIKYKESQNNRKTERYFRNIEQERLKSKERWRIKRLAVLNFVSKGLGLKCIKCGFDDIRAIQVDHIYGGGCEEARQFKDNKKYLEHITKNPHNYQLLCANCNWIKRHENNEVPHVKKKTTKEKE